MLYGMIQRRHRPFERNRTEAIVLKAAIELFLEQGYSATTIKQLSEKTGIRTGNITYHFQHKEDILYLLTEELMHFHSTIIEEAHEKTDDYLFAYATEIAMQIALCNENAVAKDLYGCAYSTPNVLAMIQEWGYKKNMILFKERLPHWSERDFKNKETITSYIELSGIKSECTDDFTLEDKITLTLKNLLFNYEVPEGEQEAVIEKILASDYKRQAQDVFRQFTEQFEKSAGELN